MGSVLTHTTRCGVYCFEHRRRKATFQKSLDDVGEEKAKIEPPAGKVGILPPRFLAATENSPIDRNIQREGYRFPPLYTLGEVCLGP